MGRRRKKKTTYHVGNVTNIPRKGSKRKMKKTTVVLTDAEVKRGVKRRKKQWKK